MKNYIKKWYTYILSYPILLILILFFTKFILNILHYEFRLAIYIYISSFINFLILCGIIQLVIKSNEDRISKIILLILIIPLYILIFSLIIWFTVNIKSERVIDDKRYVLCTTSRFPGYIERQYVYINEIIRGNDIIFEKID
ncbi:MAG: hypothetical protein IJ565_02505 [Bacilli bacterium]|nr:hypothetical protein [Bacilli bacterium]